MIAFPQAQEQATHQLSQATNRRMPEPIQQMQDMLADAKKAGVTTHVYPDADTTGAASAMVMALVQRGISVVASYGENDLSTESLLAIPGWERSVEYTDLDEDINTQVTVDCTSPERLGMLEDRVMTSNRVISVDHHVTNTRFGAVNMVDELAESSTIVLLGFFDVWGIKLTTPMARALYAGLLTDTAPSQFGHSRMHTAAAHLLGKRLGLRTIGAQLLEEHPFAYLPFLGKMLSTATLVPEWGDGTGLIHVVIEHDQTAEIGHDKIESVMDIIRTTNAADVCAVLKEYEPGQWAVSLRSRELVGVSRVALEIGGGGHERAAGLTHECSKGELLQALLDASDAAAQV